MSAAVISIRGLSHSYGKGRLARQVLHDVNVDFYAGEIAIIMGPSGGGKTTLLSLAGGLRSVQSGSVRVAGLELRNANRKTLLAVRRKIGFVFQAHNLIDSLSICENVQIALSVDAAATPAGSKQMAVQLLTKVGLAEHADKRPRELSGGQNQRVAIARALVRAPQIIMADEPTAALDGASGREVVKLLGSLAREVRCTVLLVTHDTRILDIADHILAWKMDSSRKPISRWTAWLTRSPRSLSCWPGIRNGSRRVAVCRIRRPNSVRASTTLAGIWLKWRRGGCPRHWVRDRNAGRASPMSCATSSSQ